MAEPVYHFYKLYRLTGDPHWLDFALFLQDSTKQVMDWDGSLGYAEPGLMNEAIGLAPPRAHGVRKWLPWLTAVMLEPMVRLQEEYGSYDLRAIETSRVEHQRVKADDDEITWTVIPGRDNFGYDIKTCTSCASNISQLKATCAALRYCAGFSSGFNTIKFNVSNATLNPSGRPGNAVYVRHPAPPRMPDPPPFPVWPLPKSFTATEPHAQAKIDNASFSFRLAAGSAAPSLLTDALARHRAALFPARLKLPGSGRPQRSQPAPSSSDTKPGTLSVLEVFVESDTEDLQLGANESYQLHIPAPTDQTCGSERHRRGHGQPCPVAAIRAPTVWGALHGLETFAMMLEFTRETASSGVGLIKAVPISISDEPRFPHRGLMLGRW